MKFSTSSVCIRMGHLLEQFTDHLYDVFCGVPVVCPVHRLHGFEARTCQCLNGRTGRRLSLGTQELHLDDPRADSAYLALQVERGVVGMDACLRVSTVPVRLQAGGPVVDGALDIVQLDGGFQLTELHGKVTLCVRVHEVEPLWRPLFAEVDAEDTAGVFRACGRPYQLLVAVDVAKGVVHRRRRQTLRRDGKERADRHGAFRIRQLSTSDHEVGGKDVEVRRIHTAGQPPDERADTAGVVAMDVVTCSVQLHDHAFVGVRECRHDDGLVGARTEPDLILLTRRLLEYRCCPKAQQALAGDEHLPVVVAGQNDRADAGAAEPGKKVEHEFLTDVARHRIIAVSYTHLTLPTIYSV